MYCFIFSLGFKAGTGFLDIGKVAMSADDGLGIAALQLLQYKQQSSLLSCCSCVGRLALWVDASFVANANAAIVVAQYVGTLQLL